MALTVLNVAYPLAPVGPAAVGGAERIVSILDEALVARGHHSIVIAAEGSHVSGTLVPSGPCGGPLNAVTMAEAQQRHRNAIAYALAQWPVDVVHMHGVDFCEYIPDGDVPAIATLHLPLAWYPQRQLADAALRVRCFCVSTSQKLAASAPPADFPVIENGVTPFQPLPVPREEFVLALGRICPEKAFHEALEAARLADVEMLLGGRIFGFDDHQRYFHEMIRPRLDERRRFIGPLDATRKHELLCRARCVAIPSRVSETSSLVAMEALAAGTPVVAFPSGALGDIVEHGRTGFLVHDVAGMADAIKAIGAIDPGACRAAARERFSADRMVDSYEAVYEEAAEERRDACA